MRGMLRRCGAERSQLLLVIAVAGLAAGCSNGASRVANAQLFAASNNPSTSGVEASPLAPLGAEGITSASAYASPTGAPGAVASTAPAVNSAALKARGWSLDNAPIVEVTSADTAVTLSQGYGVPVGVIMEANGLKSPSEVTPGRRLIIPTYVRRDTPQSTLASAAPKALTGPGAPPTTLNEQAGITTAAATPPAGGHRVAPGETLWSISQRYGVAPGDVMAMNNLPADGTVKLGEVLKLPGSATTQKPYEVAAIDPAAAGSTLSDTVAPALEPAKPAATASAPATAPAPQNTAPQSAAPKPGDVEKNAGPSFRWPVRGRLIAGFGKQADGARNDGINLAVPAGTPVYAAEAGTVIYAGNELEGYGNLILVQHSDDWVSAYAHNEDLSVRRGDTVTRGQRIAAAGASGSVDAPQLHFELRKRSKPVDPLPHLGGA